MLIATPLYSAASEQQLLEQENQEIIQELEQEPEEEQESEEEREPEEEQEPEEEREPEEEQEEQRQVVSTEEGVYHLVILTNRRIPPGLPHVGK